VAISAQVRQQIISDAGHRCEYCKTSSKLIGMPLTMEHIQPRSLGGSDLQLNNPDIVAARALWIEVGWHPPK
jgi:5-methylcytosine-specific restriction endonuclease McrA